MTAIHVRRTVTVTVTLAVAFGLLASPAAAAGGDSLLGGTPLGDAVESGDSGIVLNLSADSERGGGEINCKLTPDTRSNPCTYDYTAPGGGGGSPLPIPVPGDGGGGSPLPIGPGDGLPIPMPPESPGASQSLHAEIDASTDGIELNASGGGGSIECEVTPDTRSNPCTFSPPGGGGGSPITPPEDFPIEPPENFPPESPGDGPALHQKLDASANGIVLNVSGGGGSIECEVTPDTRSNPCEATPPDGGLPIPMPPGGGDSPLPIPVPGDGGNLPPLPSPTLLAGILS